MPHLLHRIIAVALSAFVVTASGIAVGIQSRRERFHLAARTLPVRVGSGQARAGSRVAQARRRSRRLSAVSVPRTRRAATSHHRRENRRSRKIPRAISEHAARADPARKFPARTRAASGLEIVRRAVHRQREAAAICNATHCKRSSRPTSRSISTPNSNLCGSRRNRCRRVATRPCNGRISKNKIDETLIWQRIDAAAQAAQADVVSSSAALLDGANKTAAEKIATALHDPAGDIERRIDMDRRPARARRARRRDHAHGAQGRRRRLRAMESRCRRNSSSTPNSAAACCARSASTAHRAMRRMRWRGSTRFPPTPRTTRRANGTCAPRSPRRTGKRHCTRCRTCRETQKADARWRYLRARTLVKLGREHEAEPIFASIAQEANFHGFLAADWINQPYSICSSTADRDAGRRKKRAQQRVAAARVRILRARPSLRSAPRMGFRIRETRSAPNAASPPTSRRNSAGTTAPSTRSTRATICICTICASRSRGATRSNAMRAPPASIRRGPTPSSAPNPRGPPTHIPAPTPTASCNCCPARRSNSRKRKRSTSPAPRTCSIRISTSASARAISATWRCATTAARGSRAPRTTPASIRSAAGSTRAIRSNRISSSRRFRTRKRANTSRACSPSA